MEKEKITDEENTTIKADFSQGLADPVAITIPKKVYDRLKQTAESKLTPKNVLKSAAVVGAVAGVGYFIKRSRDSRNHIQLDDLQNEEFTRIYLTYYDDILNYLRFRVNNQSDAEHLTQEVFISAYRNFHNFKPKQGLENPEKSWLYKIASNKRINHYRDKSRKAKEVDLGILDFFNIQHDAVDSNISYVQDHKLKKLREAINSLKEDEKLILYLKQFEILTTQDIAFVLGRTDGATKSFYYRTLKKIEERIN